MQLTVLQMGQNLNTVEVTIQFPVGKAMALLQSKAALLPSQCHREENFAFGPQSNHSLVELHLGPLAAPCHVGPEHAHEGQRQLRSS